MKSPWSIDITDTVYREQQSRLQQQWRYPAEDGFTEPVRMLLFFFFWEIPPRCLHWVFLCGRFGFAGLEYCRMMEISSVVFYCFWSLQSKYVPVKIYSKSNVTQIKAAIYPSLRSWTCLRRNFSIKKEYKRYSMEI
ncbi:hypothetical protein TSAR_005578 [Trichomalopsis sarcophagae]|uniref:Uncharacterized protein n=1 Tax=Trichomalopsis sarcophagae TaxID=543379 RepID=A0A232EPB7_9HYME|nr:hypothetical protein TSAR_005578 [Trichomalopsis sarcophagae]